MTSKTIDDLMRRASSLPEEAQEELEHVIAEMEQRYSQIYVLSDDEREAIERSLQDMRQGHFATDEQVRAIFDKARAHRA